MQISLLPIVSGSAAPLSQLPSPTYDEQLGITFTQNFASLAYNVTAVPQTDSYGYGPAYLLSGLSNDGYWYQAGLSYDWPIANGGYKSGFNFNYEVFNSAGKSIYPISGGGGLESFSSTVNSGDLVLLSLYFNSGFVYMSAQDWNTSAVADAAYADSQTSSFTGLSSPSNGNGFFTGLMTEWYHVNPYTGDETQVTYSNYSSGLSSAWMWMDEWEPGTDWSGAWSTSTQVTYSTNPTQLQPLSAQGAIEYSSAYQFITGSIVQQMTTITLVPASGSMPLSATNEFAVSFTLDDQPWVSYAQNGTLTFTADNGTNVVISGVSTGSSSTEEWVLNSQGANVTVPAGSTTTFYYYQQYQVIASYSTSDGSVPSSHLTLSGTQCGTNYQLLLTTTNQETWLDANTPWSISTVVIATSGTEQWISSSGTSGSVTGATAINPIYVHQYYLTVTSTYGSPSGSGWYDSSSTAYAGLNAGTVSGGVGTQYVFTVWSSDASGTNYAQSNAILMSGPETAKASWQTQYLLTVTSTYGTTSGAGWYDSGLTAYASVASNIVSGGTGIQHVLTGWSGDSSGSGTTSNGITMNSPETATASWITQYYLTVSSAYGSPSLASGWFEADSNINESVTSPLPESIITQHVCDGWTATGSAPATGTNASLLFTINQPSSITWNWQSQFILPRILLMLGAPLITAIIGLSIYLFRNSQKFKKRK